LKRVFNSLVLAIVPPLACLVIKLLSWSIREETVNSHIHEAYLREGKPSIFAFWHGRLLMMAPRYRGKRIATLISLHQDGELISKTISYFGHRSIRGSSTRGGFSAMREMVRTFEEGYDIAITPDGPRGPRYRVQNGIIELARQTGMTIIPVAFNASRKKVFRSWDRFLLPFPFSRGVFVFGESIKVPRNSDKDIFQEKQLLLEKRLREITDRADRYFDKRCRDT
jgi:lysophospholipid acyltransferase (LPLAT)-like uncharacterized protein